MNDTLPSGPKASAWGPSNGAPVPLSLGGTYVYAVESATGDELPNDPATLDCLRQRFAATDERLAAILDYLAMADTARVPVHFGELIDLPRIDFGHGRVLLIGDAAHAMMPNMGQGAAMAIEDAGALALLADNGSFATLATRLSETRRPRVAEIHARSWRIGQVAHWENRLACWARNLALRSMPDFVLERQVAASWQPGIDLHHALAAARPAMAVPTLG